MSQELLRRHVLRVLRAWRGWFIFGDDFLNGLQVRVAGEGLLRPWLVVAAARTASSAACSVVHTPPC